MLWCGHLACSVQPGRPHHNIVLHATPGPWLATTVSYKLLPFTERLLRRETSAGSALALVPGTAALDFPELVRPHTSHPFRAKPSNCPPLTLRLLSQHVNQVGWT